MTGDGTCHCGCGQKTSIATKTQARQGYVKGEPVRYLPGHHTRKSPVDWIEDPDTHCWVWQGGIMGRGYGSTSRNGRKTPAHRALYEDLIGPIPEGLQIDHLCRNRACVNPGHLEPVTQRENILRGEARSAENARKTHCVHGHPLSGENLYLHPDGSRRCRACHRNRARARRRKAAA